MAILKIYDILLDIKRATTNNKIEVVEGDNGNVFRIFLTDNNEPVDLSDTRVVAVFSSGDGTAEQDTSDTAFGEYTLTWNGAEWVINSLRTVDDLDLCGITLTGGTPVIDDTVTVTYNEDGATAVTSIAGATVTVDRTTFARSLASVMIGGADNNEIDILVRAGSYSSSGINECEIQIYSGDDDVLVTTAKFNFQSRRSSLNDETLVSEEKFPILVSLIAQANDALARAYKFTNVNASATDLAPHSDPTASVTVGDDSVTFVFGIPLPNGIVSVTKSGTGAAGTKDTYTITFSDNTTFSFEVYNGKDGQGSPGSSLPKALGTANAGSAIAYSREDHVHPKPSPADIDAVPSTRTVNGNALSSDVTLDADDVPTDSVGVSVQDALDSKATTATYTATIGTTWVGADAVHEATGDKVEFVAEESMPLVDLSADISPVQDLHGYDNPWAGGAGKNLLTPALADRTNAGVTFAPTSDGGISIVGTATANAYSGGNYSTYNNCPIKLPAGTYTFSTHGVLGTNSAQRSYIAIRKSSDDSLVEPFSTTFGDVSVTFTVDEDFGFFYWIFCKSGDTYNNTISLQLELGSNATAFEPYSNICPISGWSNVNVYREAQYDAGATPYATINLNGTVYGGTLDVTTGVLTVTWAEVDLGDYNWGLSASGRFYNAGLFPNFKRATTTAERASGMLCSCYPFSSNLTFSDSMDDNSMLRAQSVQGYDLVIRATAYGSDTNAFKTAMKGVQLIYELATPQTVQLTAEQIDTLLGDNVIWADTGDVDVQYKVTSDPVPYSQVVSVSGLLATDNPIVDIVPSDTYATAETQLEAWGSIYRIVTDSNQITVYATEETSVSIPIQIKCVR